jgi:WD40 repeat protein
VKCLLNKKFDFPLWKVSWSHCGSYLAVSGGDNSVYIFSENVDGTFEELSQINQENNGINNSNNEILINN